MAKTPPILFIIFNRPDHTSRVFEAIRKARPQQLFIAADGARINKVGEKELCEVTRSVVNKIDWQCEVKTRFQDKNLGCKQNVSGSITWFFENVESGIILEDDCLPVPSFFPYCAELLERYKNNTKVMHINGSNFLKSSEITDPKYSYRFSDLPQIWGWATWKRAWEKYDISMNHLDEMSSKHGYLKFLLKHLKHVRDKNTDTWDAQWQYTTLYQNGYAIIPNTNLVENIGFGSEATHTKGFNDINIPVSDMVFPLKHPLNVNIDNKADIRLVRKIYIKNVLQKIILRLKLILIHK